MTKSEQEARSRLATARKALADYTANDAKEAKAAAAAAKRLATITKNSPLVLALIANEHRAMRLAEIEVGWGAKEQTEKQLLQRLLTPGEAGIKVRTTANGQEVSIVGLQRRTRVPTPDDEAALRRSMARVEKAKAALRAAMEADKALRDEAFERGTKIEAQAIAGAVAHAEPVRRVAQSRRYASMDDYKRKGLEREVEQAQLHADAAKARAECECGRCAAERRDAKAKADEAARIKALPRKNVPCPVHGPKLMPVDRAVIWVESKPGSGYNDRRIDNYPVAICPVDGQRYRLATLFEQERAAQVKAAKAARKAA